VEAASLLQIADLPESPLHPTGEIGK